METECNKDILTTDYKQIELKKSNYELNLFSCYQCFRDYKYFFLKHLKYDFNCF
jgi:hypothetical protein